MRALKGDIVDDRVAFSLARLQPNEDFQVFVGFLERTRDQHDMDNRNLEGTELYRGQGCAITIDEILDLFAQASQIANRIQASR